MPGPQRSPQCPIIEIFKKEHQTRGEETHGEMVEEMHGEKDGRDDVQGRPVHGRRPSMPKGCP